MERETGIEPATNSLEGCDSTTELLPPFRSATSAGIPISPMNPGGNREACQNDQHHMPDLKLCFWNCRRQVHPRQDGEERIRGHCHPHTIHRLLVQPKSWCTGEDSNLRSSKERQVYSLLPLTARPPVHFQNAESYLTSGPCRRIKNKCARTAITSATCAALASDFQPGFAQTNLRTNLPIERKRPLEVISEELHETLLSDCAQSATTTLELAKGFEPPTL